MMETYDGSITQFTQSVVRQASIDVEERCRGNEMNQWNDVEAVYLGTTEEAFVRTHIRLPQSSSMSTSMTIYC